MGVDCSKKYEFSDTKFGWKPKNVTHPLTAQCKKALIPAVTYCNKKYTDYKIADYY